MRTIILNKEDLDHISESVTENVCDYLDESGYKKSGLYSVVYLLIATFSSIAWLFGFVLAKGFWSTLFCIIPFYSWYLVCEWVVEMVGIAVGA